MYIRASTNGEMDDMKPTIKVKFAKVDTWHWNVMANGEFIAVMSKNSEGCLHSKFEDGAEFWTFNQTKMKEMMERHLNGGTK